MTQTFSLCSTSPFDTANTGDFTLATELGDTLTTNVAGRVGINTASPTVALEVEGDLKVNGTILNNPDFMAQVICGAINPNFDYGRAFKAPAATTCNAYCAGVTGYVTCVGGMLVNTGSTARYACTYAPAVQSDSATYCCCR